MTTSAPEQDGSAESWPRTRPPDPARSRAPSTLVRVVAKRHGTRRARADRHVAEIQRARQRRDAGLEQGSPRTTAGPAAVCTIEGMERAARLFGAAFGESPVRERGATCTMAMAATCPRGEAQATSFVQAEAPSPAEASAPSPAEASTPSPSLFTPRRSSRLRLVSSRASSGRRRRGRGRLPGPSVCEAGSRRARPSRLSAR